MTADRPMNYTKRFEVRPTSDSHFSWLRTRMSTERTLMSWVGTGVSLVGIGFTIVQFNVSARWRGRPSHSARRASIPRPRAHRGRNDLADDRSV